MVCFPTITTVVSWSHLQPLALTPLLSLWPHGVPLTHQAHFRIRIVVLAVPSDKRLLSKHLCAFLPDFLLEAFAQRLLLIEPSLTTTSSSLSHAQTAIPLAYFIFFHSIGHIIYFTVIYCLHISSVKLRIFFCFVHFGMPSNSNRAWQKVGPLINYILIRRTGEFMQNSMCIFVFFFLCVCVLFVWYNVV